MKNAQDFRDELCPQHGRDATYIDAEIIAHRGIAQVMALLIFGKVSILQGFNVHVVYRRKRYFRILQKCIISQS